jgi:hypothetical protein
MGFLLAVFGLVFGLIMRHHIGVFFTTIRYPGRSDYPPGQIVLGFVCLVLILMSIAGLLKILFYRGSQS